MTSAEGTSIMRAPTWLVELPWLLEKAAKWLLPALRKQATLLLEKK